MVFISHLLPNKSFKVLNDFFPDSLSLLLNLKGVLLLNKPVIPERRLEKKSTTLFIAFPAPVVS